MPRRRGGSNAFATDVPAERIRLTATALVLLMREFDRVRTLGVCRSPMGALLAVFNAT